MTAVRALGRGALALVMAVAYAGCGSAAEQDAAPKNTPTSEPVVSSTVAVAIPNAVTHPPPSEGIPLTLDTATDSELLRPVSKRNAVGEQYVPPDLVTLHASLVAPGYPERRLRREAAEALATMVAAAAQDGVELRVVSAYRSYSEQVVVHQGHVDRRGALEASRRSAPPGHSEHQLGTTVDLSGRSVLWRLTGRLAEAPEGQWLAAHAYEHGFALSYPEGAETTTGYSYEPWHLRYIGRDHAARWRESGVTLVEYLEALASG